MIQILKAVGTALWMSLLLALVLIVLGASYLLMIIAGQVAFLVLYGLFYWKPTAIHGVIRKFVERVRIWV